MDVYTGTNNEWMFRMNLIAQPGDVPSLYIMALSDASGES